MPLDGTDRADRARLTIEKIEILRDLCSQNMEATQTDFGRCLWSEARAHSRLIALGIREAEVPDVFGRYNRFISPDLAMLGRFFTEGLEPAVPHHEAMDWFRGNPKQIKLAMIERALAGARALETV